MMPVGITVQAAFFNNEWVLATKSVLRANESKFNGDVTLYEKVT